jgi:cobaltochelatase CobN
MYAFDPRLVPTASAEARSNRAADLLCAQYVDQHGRFLKTIGLVLWGFEIMKTGGDTVAMALALMGVKINRKKNPWFKELELLSPEAIGRPRVDVMITICGIFRDTFGTEIELLDRAVSLVAMADEPADLNPLRAHCAQK